MTAKKVICITVSMMLLLSAFAGCSMPSGNNADPEMTTKENFDVDIGFTTLSVPSKWADYIRISRDFEGLIGTVDFYGTAGNHDEQLLFTLCFNQDGEIPVGTLVTDGQNVIISSDMNELEFDESWAQSEKDTLCAMQEDINYIIKKLKENSDFTPY